MFVVVLAGDVHQDGSFTSIIYGETTENRAKRMK